MEKSKSIFNTVSLLSGIFLVSLCVNGCGGVSANLNPTPSPRNDVPMALVLGSDYDRGSSQVGSLNLLTMNAPRTPTSNIQTTHSDAVVRVYDNKIYVVNRLGADNIQILDPSQNFRVTLQCSVGLGTNPQDIIVVSATKAFVSLYQPLSNRSSLTVGDVLIVNPSVTDCSQFITGHIDLQSYTATAGDRYPRASSMLLINNKIYVAVQDLPRNLTQEPNVPGSLIEIDPATNAVTRTLRLTGYDPIAMDYSPQTELIYVANSNFFALGSGHGGIEVIDPTTLTSRGILLSDTALEGVPANIKIGRGRGFVTVGPVIRSEDRSQYPTKVISFTLTSGNPTDPTLMYNGRAYIQDIAVDPFLGLLLVGDRDPRVNGIVLIDPSTHNIIDGPITTGPSPSSIAFLNTTTPTSVPTVPTPTEPPTETRTDPIVIDPTLCAETAPPTPDAIYPSPALFNASRDLQLGINGGFGGTSLIFGAPIGAGLFQGSTDVLSLGKNGTITVAFDNYIICNGPGTDFTVFENAFQFGDGTDLTYREPATVSVSEDGITFYSFPCDLTHTNYPGCAGTHPVFARTGSSPINPRDPSISGGDGYDLADLGLTSIRFIRIHDEGLSPDPIGPMKEGFDLDAVVIVHGRTR